MTLGPRPALALNLPAIAVAGALTLLAQSAGAQQPEPPKAESLERAQKAADAVFHWIKLNADKGATRQTPAPAAAPAPAPRKPAAGPAPVAAAPKPAATPTGTATPAQALAPAPSPVTAAAAPEPEPDRTPVVLASAAPIPAPAAPLTLAARAVEPPPPAAEEAEVPLRLLVKVDPAIPRQLQAQSFRNGFAQVQFTVAPDGTVTQVQAIKASHARLGGAAVEAVKQWRFAPIPKAREAAVEVAFKNADD